MNCYFVVDTYIDVNKGRGAYDDYIEQVKPIVESFGGEYLVRSEKLVALVQLVLYPTEEFMNRFIEKNGSVVCRELLEYDMTKTEDIEIIKDKNLVRTFCPEMVRSAADILDEMID